jgi:CRP-like cAMP-binding protein
MSAPRARPRPGDNRLLSILPPASRERLLGLAQRVGVHSGQVLVHAGQPIEHAYFPLSGVLSLLVIMSDGASVEAATVGFDGMAGLAIVLGEEVSPHAIAVQVSGELLRIPARHLRQMALEDEPLRRLLLRFAHVLFVQSGRNAACNRLHQLEKRLARWLLHIHDWVWEDRFFLTQDLIAQMLGVRRPTVTVAAGALARGGAIAYKRGYVTVLERAALEQAACEDYAAIRETFERLLKG